MASDLDLDGDLDLVSASRIDDTLAVYTNQTIHRSAVFPQKTIITNTAAGASAVFSVDLDGDGDVDVLSASGGDNRIAWYENDGALNYTPRVISANAAGASAVTARDLDGDGDLDVLSASTDDGRIAWYENNGSQGFTERVISSSALAAAAVFAMDVDGDGDLDVLSASTGDDKIAWYENDGNRGFTERAISTTADGATSVFAADVDGDGDIDVLSASGADNKIAWHENDGQQGFTERVISTTAAGASSVLATDLDHDGDVDVLAASGADNTIAWYENNGNQNFTFRTISTAAIGARALIATDVDGDGDTDVVSASAIEGKIAWYENDGRENFIARTISVTAAGATSVFGVDLDRDGDVDVLSASGTDNTIAFYPNRGGQFALDTLDMAPGAVASGDTNVPVLRIDALHRGRTGDRAEQLTRIDLRFETAGGMPLSTIEASALVSRLSIHRDNGDTAFNPANDALVTSLTSFNLVAGVQTITFANGDANVTYAFGQTPTYFLSVDLTQNADSQSPNALRIIHLTESSGTTARDATSSIPLRLEHAANVGSGTLAPPPPVPDSTPDAFAFVDINGVTHGADQTSTSTVLTVGGITDTFTSITRSEDAPVDITPDAFTFTNVTGASLNSTQISNTVTITGLETTAPISVTGGSYSIGCNATFVAAAGTIENGQSVCVRHAASAAYATTVTTALDIGGVAATFSSTTLAAPPADPVFQVQNVGSPSRCLQPEDGSPSVGDAMSAKSCDANDVAQRVTFSPGTDGSFRMMIGGFCMGPTAAIADGTRLQLQACNGSSSQNFTVNGTRIGPVNDPSRAMDLHGGNTNDAIFWFDYGGTNQRWNRLTLGPPPIPDTTPNAFSFAAATNVRQSSIQTSGAVTVTGINTAAPISVVGGSYSVGCGTTFVSTAGTIANGQTVCLRHTASASLSTTTTTTLNIGGVMGAYSSTTSATSSPPPDSTPDPFNFTSASSVARGSTQTSNAVPVTGIDTPTPISVTGGAYSIGCTGVFTTAPGLISASPVAISILPVGDSLTAGDNPETTNRSGGTSISYRGPLIQNLPARNYAVDMMGRQNNPPRLGGDGQHEGHGGAVAGPTGTTTNNIDVRIAAIKAASPNPQYITVVLGQNDIYNYGGADANAFLTRFPALLNRMKAEWPFAKFVVAVSPYTPYTAASHKSTWFDPAHNAIKALEAADPVRFKIVDIRNALSGSAGDFVTDSTHWSESGAAKVGRIIADGFTAGQTVCVRHTASSSDATATTTTLDIGGVTGSFTSTTVGPPPDTTPNPFSFSGVTGVPLSSVQTSNAVTISGINAATPISVTGGTYSVGCTGTFTSAAGTITNGQGVCLSHTASASASTMVTTTLSIGGVSGSFSSTTVAADSTPDPFTFTSATGVPLGSIQTSDPITVSGIEAAVPISVAGGTYSIGCGVIFVSTASTISNGQTVCLRHTASSAVSTLVTTSLNIGGVVGSFASTTEDADITPDAFIFTDVAGVPLGTTQTSAPITVAGINSPAPISVEGGSYSIGCSASFVTAASTISNGQTVCLRHTASSAVSTLVTTSLNIGGVTGSFSSTTTSDPTPPPDTTPDVFTFTDVTDVALGSIQTSAPITVVGIDAPASISVVGGSYSIGCSASFVTAASTIANGQTVCLRHTASAANATVVTTTLNIGGVSGSFSSTTLTGTPPTDPVFQVQNVRSTNLCLQPEDGSPSAGDPMSAKTCNANSAAQRVSFPASANGSVRMVIGGLCVGTPGGFADGTRLQLQTCNGSTNQNFIVNGTRIGPANSSLQAMDLHAGNLNDVIFWRDYGGTNQRWNRLPR
ncbi:MAG: FG-GAP-like repeat-containing protein [Panacagrimonas sp.]